MLPPVVLMSIARSVVEDGCHCDDGVTGMDSRRIGMRGRGEAVHSDKPGIDIVEQIGPDLADVCQFRQA